MLGLVGENGAGKSTLMKILFGMDVIRETGGYEGDVLIDGEKVQFNTPFDALKAGIGMVHQEFSLIPGFTATENILLNREPKKKSVISEVFGPRLDTLDYKEMDNRAAKAIEKMGVAIDQKMVISSMPVGHKQFTEIARELSKENLKLLILDEPTAVLTEQEAQALLDSIRGMASRGIAVIFITHRLQEILSVCDKVVIMRDGYVVKDVAARETDVRDITHYMVGREVAAGGAAHDIRDHSDARTILSIRKLWVDMPGEIVRNVDLDVKEGEILGIGGLAGQGKLGIPNGVMGLYEAGGTVEFDGKPIALNSPRKCLDSQLAFVSEDRRGVGLLLDESLEWNVAFPAMQVQNKFLKRLGFFTWRDEKAIHHGDEPVYRGAADQVHRLRPEGQRAVRRQPAEGVPGQGVRAGAPLPLRVRAYPRHRRGRQGAGAGGAEEIQPRVRRHGGDDLLRAGGAAPGLRPHRHRLRRQGRRDTAC